MQKIILLSFLVISITTYSQLYINEFLASNTYINYDPQNTQFTDWIEIYNSGVTDINIGEYFLTDDSLETQKWQIPTNTIISANGYYIFWADKKNTGSHTNFGLSREGEYIGIYNNTGLLVDELAYYSQEADISYGRNINNITEWGFFHSPTPNSANNTEIFNTIKRAKEPTFSVIGGVYSSSQTVELFSILPTAEIRYTTDGNNPTLASNVYTTALNIDTLTNLRARCFDTNLMPSHIVTNTYILGTNHTLPILSITTEPKNFYGNTIGIYCIGTNGINGYGVTANYWHRDWERPANIEFFEEDGTQKINQLSGVELNGERRNMGQKSIRLHARNKYSKPTYNYKIFNQTDIHNFASLVLRNGGLPDFSYSLIRDNFSQYILFGKTKNHIQASRKTVVYVNGEYFGIYSIKEKQNEKYLASHYKIDPNNVDMLENANATIIEGTNDDYLYLLNMLRNNNTNDLYELIDKNIDIAQYLDYLTAEIYMGNSDWPTINIKFWKEKNELGKWRWLIYDTDASFMELWGGHNYNSIHHAFRDDGPNWPNSPTSTEFIRLLTSNNKIRYRFLQTFAAHANTTFLPSRIIPIIDTMKTEIESEIPNHILKWKNYHSEIAGDCVQSVSDWEAQIDTMKHFANNRWNAIRQHAINWFNLNGDFDLTTTSNNGTIYVHSVSLNQGTNTGKYFKNVPITFKATPNIGYKFAHWEGASTSINAEISLTLNENSNLIAIFEPDNETILPTTISSLDTLYYNKSPYIGYNDLTITASGYLFIEPGVEVYMPENKSIYVYGNLEAAGTQQLPILLDVNSNIGDKNWGALCFYNATNESHLNYLTIKNTTTGADKELQKAAISSFNSTIYINNIDISSCYQPFYSEYGSIYISNSKLQCSYTCDIINIKYADNALVENCDIKGSEAPDTDGIDYDDISNGIIRNNKIYGFNGFNSDGVDVGEEATNILIENNLIFNCTDKGISVGQASSIIAKNNVIYNCNMGIGIKDSLSVANIENNTLYNNTYAVACFEKNFEAGGGIAYIKNSILSSSIKSPILIDQKSNITTTYSCSNTQALEGNSNIQANPQFVDTLTMNFELLSSSPCIDTGSPSSPIDTDGSIVDMGAYYNFSTSTNNSIVINEINYFPYPLYNSADWVELHNKSNLNIDLSGWIFSDGNKEHIYKIPEGFVLKANNYIVFCSNKELFIEIYPTITNFRGNIDFNFKTNGEMLRLYDAQMNLVDFVEYSDNLPWPNGASGTGNTLELISPDLDNNLGQNWRADKSLGSPGENNSPDYVNNINNFNNLVLYPNPTNSYFSVNVKTKSVITIYSIDGAIISSINNYNGELINVYNYKTGVYLVKIISDNRVLSEKLIIK